MCADKGKDEHDYENTILKQPIVITIDGPSASGKGTVSRELAKRLGYTYVDTGAMYRTLAWHCLKDGIDVHDEKKVASACRRWKATLECANGEGFLTVAGYRPEKETRSAFDQIKSLLQQGGFTITDIVAVQVYMADLAEFPKMNAVYRAMMPDPKPTRTTVQVAKLVGDARIEITVTAVKTKA